MIAHLLPCPPKHRPPSQMWANVSNVPAGAHTHVTNFSKAPLGAAMADTSSLDFPPCLLFLVSLTSVLSSKSWPHNAAVLPSPVLDRSRLYKTLTPHHYSTSPRLTLRTSMGTITQGDA